MRLKLLFSPFLTGQEQEVAGQKFVWPVKMTDNLTEEFVLHNVNLYLYE